jgi:hypothetical protein
MNILLSPEEAGTSPGLLRDLEKTENILRRFNATRC